MIKYCGNSYMQWLATFGVCLLLGQEGISIGWNSPNAFRLQSEDSPIRLTSSELSWLFSSTTVSGMIGAIIGSVSIECWGSRKTLLLTYIVAAVSWACLIIADSAVWIFAGRTLCGISIMMMYCSFSLYLGEISDPKIRGTLISISVCGSMVGTVMSSITETYISMKVSSLIYLVMCLIGIGMFWWFKDTPYYLVKRGRLQSAEESIAFYRPACPRDKEMSDVKKFVALNDQQNILAKLAEFKRPAAKKSVLLIVSLNALAQLSGFMAIISYLEPIFESSKFDLVKPEESVIYVNIICAIVSILTVNTIDSLGRRFLLIYSSAGMIICLIGLGLHFYLASVGYDAKMLQWLPVSSIILYMITYSFGFNAVPSTILSEIFAENMKSTAACLAMSSSALFAFTATKIYQPLIDAVGESYTFWIFALIPAVILPIVLHLLPETKGKTFLEIQNLLAKKATHKEGIEV